MCGRYNLRTSRAELERLFGPLDLQDDDFPPRYNIAPTQSVPAVRASIDGRELAWFRWGLIPSWTGDPTKSRPFINARAETVAEKPSFRSAFKHRRCLIPASGFYEWKKTGSKTKQPYHIHFNGDSLFAMAGIWEYWNHGSPSIESFAIITTTANASMSNIHDRMPVILHPGQYDQWLGDNDEPAKLLDFLAPYSGDVLNATPISTAVNNARNDSEECLFALE